MDLLDFQKNEAEIKNKIVLVNDKKGNKERAHGVDLMVSINNNALYIQCTTNKKKNLQKKFECNKQKFKNYFHKENHFYNPIIFVFVSLNDWD